jgi:hypothetical protein
MVLILAAHDAHDIPSTRWISFTTAIGDFLQRYGKMGSEGGESGEGGEIVEIGVIGEIV